MEEIEGNLIEYHDRLGQKRKLLATLRYWYQVLHYIRLSTLRPIKINSNKGPMFTFRPLQALRLLMRHGTSALINISGFTIGLVCIVFLYFHISGEMSYDDFHEDKDKIYRAIRIGNINETEYDIGVTSGPYGPALVQDFENTIYDACRVQMPFSEDNRLVSFDDEKFIGDEIIFADPHFFGFFSFELKTGDPKTVLENPNQVVISDKLAEKYFRGENPIGKTIYIDLEDAFIVSGVFKDLGNVKSHFTFDIVASIEVFTSASWFNRWWNNGLITYVKVETPIEAEGVNQQLPSFMDKYFGDDFESMGTRVDLKLEPLADTYFNHNTRYDTVKHGNFRTLQILGMVGFAILLIASFNYVNLSIAFSFHRAREVGIKKVLGAPRKRLMIQFLGESLFVLTFSFVMAIVLSELLRPWINGLFQLDVTYQWFEQNTLVFFGGLFVALLALSSLYPATLMSSFAPLKVLNGWKLSFGKSINLRKSLVILQFSISIFMIAATLLILSQLDYIQEKDLGFDREAVVIVSNYNRDIRTNIENFKNDVLGSPHVKNVSSMSGEPGGFHDASVIEVPGVEHLVRMRTLFTDHNYLKTFNAEIVAGSDFNEELSQENAVIVNEAGLKEIGLSVDELIGNTASLPSWDVSGKVIGVVKDFHFTSLHDEIEPLVIILRNRHHGKYAISLNSGNIFDGMQHIEEVWAKYSPVYPIKYSFLDDSLDQLYENEIKQGRVFTAFAGISVFLACIGVFGLVSYTARQRQKELSIRKILGAGVQHILKLLSQEYLIILAAALLIATPLCWWFVQNWLETFAYRIELASFWYVFLFSGVVAILLAFATIAVRTYRSAYSNPIESIKYE